MMMMMMMAGLRLKLKWQSASAATGADDDSNGHSTPLRSMLSSSEILVRFENSTRSTPLKLYWVNYDGDEEFYAELPANGGYYEVDTFDTHPWRFRDRKK